MTSYAELMDEDRRLVILRLLVDSGDYTSNEYLLQTALQRLGHAVGGERLRADLAWLTEQGLITCEHLAGVVVASLTPRGDDIAAGRERHPGVKRPRPGL